MKALQAEGELQKQFKSELARASGFFFGMALVTSRGFEMLRPHIEHFLKKGGQGAILFGVDLPTEPKAIECFVPLRSNTDRFSGAPISIWKDCLSP